MRAVRLIWRIGIGFEGDVLAAISDQDLANFIRSTFRSVWSIELLVLLQNPPIRAWTPAELVESLRASQLVIAQGTDGLLAAGLVTIDAEALVRYQPASSELDDLAHKATALYARSPNAVRRLIVSNAASGLTAFADAFRIRKD